jgi:Fanconi anemia group M protein
MEFVQHPLIKDKTVEKRLYQEVLAARVLDQGNSLIVAPTALGKTVIAALISAFRLNEQPKQKILFLAPTKPLAQQHEKSFKKLLNLDEEQIVLMTGSTKPSDRKKLWKEATVISATPQTVESDLMAGRLDLKNVGLCIFDECHRAIGDYSYVFLAQQYMKQFNCFAWQRAGKEL